MTDEARLNEILDVIEQARREGDKVTESRATAAYRRETAGLSAEEKSGARPDDLKFFRSESQRMDDARDADPAYGQSSGENYLAGMGKFFTDIGLGVRQIGANVADAVSPRQATVADLVANRDPSRSAALLAEADQKRATDAPLMNTAAGQTGNVMGAVAATAPAMMIPGGQTLLGSAATGAAMGAAQPVATGESRLENTAIGGVLGGAAPAAARTLGAVWRAGKAAIEPFTQAGRERIAGRVMERFGVQPGDLAGVSSQPTRTGARPTLAEQITRPEGAAAAARLQDQIRAANPEAAAQMTAREEANNAARVGVLERLSTNNGQRASDEALRESTAKTLYGESFKGKIDPEKMTSAERGEFTKVLRMPAVEKAMASAQENMANKGLVGEARLSMRALHETKLAMDDEISALSGPKATADMVNRAHAIRMARDRLVTFMERHSPGENYKYARQFYAEQSVPINQADIAEELLSKGASTTTDLSGNPRLSAAALTRQMSDQSKLIKSATGRDLGGDLSEVLTPDQLADINAVVGETDRAAAVARAGNGPGSATAQRLAGSNVVSQAVSGTGLPQGLADSTLVQEALARPISWLLKAAGEPRIQMTLADAILNPAAASRAMMAANPAQRTALANILRNQYLQQAARQSLPATAQANRR